MMQRNLFWPVLIAAVFMPASGLAQIRASELAGVSQTIDGTRISVQYSRPQSRGRDTLFGRGDRNWGHTWTPGANWATTFETSKPVRLNGNVVPKGKYSVWMRLNSATSWTMILDPAFRVYHMDPPDSSAKQIRFPVTVHAAPFTDVLTWSMPALRIDGGTLQFAWERARVEVQLDVEPSLTMTFPAGEAAAYLGVYDYVPYVEGKPRWPVKFTITHEDNTLKGQFDPDDPYLKKFALIRIAPDWFAPGVYDKSGRIYEVMRPEETWEFTRKGGRVTTFLVRSDTDVVIGKATRKP
ncbi:MAG: DUF2911 domain-containing protein [Phycisphaerae bacterium]|nr:DUF2911 domain-containing protein [Gemmatimonadaceae bacterium]